MVTNEDVLRFYAGKGEEGCELTKKYMSKKPIEITGKDDYTAVFYAFQTEGKKGNKDFYDWLKNQDLSKTLSLREVHEKDKSFDDFILKPKTESVLINKWHLYVSYYALNEFNKKLNLKTYSCSGFKCEELLLWMYEASNPDKNSETYKEIKKRVNKNEDFSDLIIFLKCQIKETIEKWKMKYTYIVKTPLLPLTKFYLKLDRTSHTIDVYEQDSGDLREFYSLRKDFDASNYSLFTLKKSIPCIFGGEDETRTPAGIFQVEQVSQPHEEYISSYHPKYKQVKFFGYLVIFEDYFIHSDMYLSDADCETFMQKKTISSRDSHTSGCIRVSQENLDWLTENIPQGTVIEM